MQGDKPRFLDVIQSVNGKAYTELTGSNIQEAFDKATSCHSSISLQVNRCIALAPPARLISKGLNLVFNQLVNNPLLLFCS